jgi:GT2 family glycosyltransferase
MVDILIPTFQRSAALAITLTGLVYQEYTKFQVIISDQSEEYDISERGEVAAVVNLLRAHGNPVTFLKNLPRRGMAHQRQFLLDQAQAPYVLFLDDDVLLENYVLRNMVQAIQEEGCGFVGCALTGLSYVNDVRPQQQAIEFWDRPVAPEQVRPGTSAWERYILHNAANIFHVARRFQLSPDRPRKYKVAWVGGCVLYDTARLLSAGGYSFWNDLPAQHAGEDVLAQLRVMEESGGCGLVPSGAYHLELQTTLPDRSVDAPKVLTIEGENNEPESS